MHFTQAAEHFICWVVCHIDTLLKHNSIEIEFLQSWYEMVLNYKHTQSVLLKQSPR